MKSLSKDKVLRWVSGQQPQGGSGGGGVSVDFAGYATQIWTEQNYVNKEFFSSLFKAYDANGNEVLPNDTETTIDNIKAMFGFWTDFYISALGTGGQQSVDLRLAQLADVNVAGVTNGQVLTYDSTANKWIASTPQSGTDMNTVWANLAASGNQQIDASHLLTALTGYATQTWVNTQINDMATKTWVGQNYLSKNDAALTYLSKTDAASTYLSIAFFNRLFKAYNGTTQVNPNDTTTAIDNIKAMFGFWTDFYISALGNGGQQSVDLRLAQLADVNVAGVTNGQVLTYDSTTGKWIASTPQSGTDMNTVWANLAASGNQQIDVSHLSTALNGYATQTWVNTQINDMATKTYVDNTYLPLTAGSSKPITGPLFFNRSNKDYRLDANDSNDAYRHMIRLRYSVDADTNVMTATMVLNETATISQSYVAANSEGFQILTLGNNIHLNAAENMYGAIRLYGKRQTGSPDATVRYVQFVPDVITANRTYTLPNQSGTLAMTGDITTALNGYATQTWVNTQINDMATQTWVGQNYLSKNDAASTYLSKTDAASTYLSITFFNRLFKAYNGTTQVNPNDTETAIDNIKAMFGFWTDFYISALGNGGQQSVDLRLAQLADVNVAGVTNGQVLTYNAATGKWIASTPQSGTDMNTVWANLAASGNQQIDASHLSTALTGYATQTWVNNQISDMATKTWANGQFLKLSGGTMTGSITMKANQYAPNYGIDMNNSDIINVNTIKTSDLSDSWDEGILFARTNGNWDSFRAADGDFYMNNNSGADGACLHVSRLVLSSTNDAQGTAWNSPALCVGGNYSGAHIEIDSNEIMAKSNASTTTTLYLNAEGGNCVINEAAGNCGIGTGSPSHKLHVNGGIYSTSYVTALSDARHKEVIGDTGLTVEDIAGAPAIRFQWNDRNDKTVFAGSIAQYWQKILPEVVQSQADDTLSLDYQVAALISSITVARKVMNHESRLQRLEKMFAINENDIED